MVAYLRVSTQQQGRSGLGLEAQRAAIARFADVQGIELAGEYVEVETGKGADALDRRPVLKAALVEARQTKAPLVVAKLDRLSRDVASIATLIATRVPFVVADLGVDVARSCCACMRRWARPRRTRHAGQSDQPAGSGSAWLGDACVPGPISEPASVLPVISSIQPAGTATFGQAGQSLTVAAFPPQKFCPMRILLHDNTDPLKDESQSLEIRRVR